MSLYVVSFTDRFQENNISFVNTINVSDDGNGYTYIGQYKGDIHADGTALATTVLLQDGSFAVTSPKLKSSLEKTEIDFLQFVLWGIVGSCLAILGFLGNFLSMVVLYRPQMRSSTSYYLISLAIYDNCILVGMLIYFCLRSLGPYISWLTNYESFVSTTIIIGYPLSLAAQMGSIYTCMAFTIERYIAVCWPLQAANTCTRSRTARAIILTFLWSFVYNIPRFFHYETVYTDNDATSEQNFVINSGFNSSFIGDNCAENFNTVNSAFNCSSNKSYNQMTINSADSQFLAQNITNLNSLTQCFVGSRCAHRSTKYVETEFGLGHTFKHAYLIYSQLFFMFLLPFLVILIMNVRLIQTVRGSKFVQQSMCASARKEHNLTIMLIAVIVVFLVCQFPTIVDNILVAVTKEEDRKHNYSYMCFYIVCTLMVEINAASNFLLYCFFGKKFRVMLLTTLSWKDKYSYKKNRSTVCRYRVNSSRTDDMEMSAV